MTMTTMMNAPIPVPLLSEPYASIAHNVQQESSSAVQYDCLEFQLRSLMQQSCEAVRHLGDEKRHDQLLVPLVPVVPVNLPTASSTTISYTTTEKTGGADVKPLGVHRVQETFQNCIQLCSQFKCEGIARLGLLLLEDIVETLPLNYLQLFYEQSQPLRQLSLLLSETCTTITGSQALHFIRVCNAMMRRLPPKSEWTGRILLELAHSLPLTDKSCWKPWGSVSPGQVDFDSSNDFEGDDYTFYQTFWSLQQDFANPFQMPLGTFTAKYTKVLTELEGFASNKTKETTTTSCVLGSQSLSFLTNSRILTPQLDSNKALKLHLLTQFAIVESFLCSNSSQLPNSINSALGSLAKRSQQLIETIDPKHASLLQTLLQSSEVTWRNWKKNKCLPSAMQIKPLLQSSRLPPSEVGLDSIITTTRSTTTSTFSVNDYGAMDSIHHPQDDCTELEFLAPINMTELAIIASSMRHVVPSIQYHLKEYVEALDPEAGIDEEYSLKREKVLGWQALRLLGVNHLKSFHEILPNGDFENLVRTVYSKEYGIVIPGEYLECVKKHDIEDETETMVVDAPQVDDENGDMPMNDPEQTKYIADWEKIQDDSEVGENGAPKLDDLVSSDTNAADHVGEIEQQDKTDVVKSSCTTEKTDVLQRVDDPMMHNNAAKIDVSAIEHGEQSTQRREAATSRPVVGEKEVGSKDLAKAVSNEELGTQHDEKPTHESKNGLLPASTSRADPVLHVAEDRDQDMKRMVAHGGDADNQDDARSEDEDAAKTSVMTPEIEGTRNDVPARISSVSDGKGSEESYATRNVASGAKKGKRDRSSNANNNSEGKKEDDENTLRRKLEDRKRKRGNEATQDNRCSQPTVRTQRDGPRGVEVRSGEVPRGDHDGGLQRHGPGGNEGGSGGGAGQSNRGGSRGPPQHGGRGASSVPPLQQHGPRVQSHPSPQIDRGNHKQGRGGWDDRRGVPDRRSDAMLQDDRRGSQTDDSRRASQGNDGRRGGRGNRDGSSHRRR